MEVKRIVISELGGDDIFIANALVPVFFMDGVHAEYVHIIGHDLIICLLSDKVTIYERDEGRLWIYDEPVEFETGKQVYPVLSEGAE